VPLLPLLHESVAVGSSTPLGGGDEFVEHTMMGELKRIYEHIK
jgi:hypothetical protein